MLRSLKRLALRSANASGMIAGVRDSRWRRQRLLILCYHGISMDDEHDWNPMLYMSPDRFRERLTRLRDGGYRVLPLAEAIRRMYDGTLPPRAVAITFDDGAHDFVARALPILTEFAFPATVYLTTYYCRLQRPVFDTAFSYLLWKAGASEFNGTDLVPDGGRVHARDLDERTALMLRVRDYANQRGLTGEEKDALLRLLAERIGADYQILSGRRLLHIMSPAEVAALPRDLIDVQLHTHRHRTPRQEEPFLRELRDNRREISALRAGGADAVHFCYPSGYHEPQFLPWLREESVATATTCVPGLASRDQDPLLLPRLVDTMNISALEFDAWLAGVAAWLPRRSTGMPAGA
jgi:peptidoglycan/xylan/chitin deacetylase (PgdA/CDA1 family)